MVFLVSLSLLRNRELGIFRTKTKRLFCVFLVASMEVFKRFVKWIQYVEYSMVIWFYRVFILRLEISIIGNLDYRCSIGWRRSQVADITPGQYYFSFSHVLCYQQASLNLWSIQNTQRGFLYQMHLHEALATRCTLLAPCCTIVTSPKDQFVRFCVSCRWKTGQWHAIDNRICCRCITLLNGGRLPRNGQFHGDCVAGSSVVACYELCEILEHSTEVLVPCRTLWEADCTPASSLGLHALRKTLKGFQARFCFIFFPLFLASVHSPWQLAYTDMFVLSISTVIWLVARVENRKEKNENKNRSPLQQRW